MSAAPAGRRPLLFIDTAVIADIEAWLATGLFHGVTTNPTILAAAGLPSTIEAITALAREIFAAGASEMQAQSWGRSRETLIRHGRLIAAIDPRMVVKIPVTREGAAAASFLKAEGIRTTITAVYAPHQAITAAALQADYVAPYLGRMNDAGRDGFAAIAAMQRIVAGTSTRVLVASLRSADDMARLAQDGVDTFTFSPKVAAELFADPLTEAAAVVFESAAER